jgi:uncharacterized protein YraI
MLLLAATIATGIAPTTALAATPVTAGGKAVVTNTDGDPIRIREGAGTQYARIAWAYQGQSVSVLDGPRNDSGGTIWFKIQAPGGTGWMMAEFLEGTSAPPSAPRLTGTARVANTNGDPLRMRSAPSTSGSVLTLLNPGATVTIVDGPVADNSGTAWYKISAKGLTGWAMAQYLAQAEPQSQPQPPASSEPESKPETAPKAEPAAEQRANPPSSKEQYRIWMEEARAMYPYRQTIDKMWAVMMCESGGNPRASGGGGRWLGLFQYAPGTWNGSWNPYRSNSIWDARSQIFATAKAWSIGMQSHWSCYYITPGR